MRIPIATALATLVVCGLASPAAAQEYCVTCSGPHAVYRCIVDGQPGVAPAPSRAQLLCITELAQSGGHASCSVGRTAVEQCAGELRTVLFPSGLPPASQSPGQAPAEAVYPEDGSAAMANGQVSPQPETPPAEGPPKTVEELAKKTAQVSGEVVSETAQSAGNVFKKTWSCLSSFFSDC